jgi:hypothetical protein
MRRSFFAMAAAAPLQTSIAVAKQEQPTTDPAESTSGPVELADYELEMVAGGSAVVTGTQNGNNSANSDNNGKVNNKIFHT